MAQTIEEKLKNLYKLQLVDSKIDSIKNLQGELPLEVEDLKDEIEGLKIRVEKDTEKVDEIGVEIGNKEIFIQECKSLINKYSEQQKNVRNSREFDSLSKELEYQELEVQLAEKQIKELGEFLKEKKGNLRVSKKLLKEKKEHLKIKKEELVEISAETAKEEEKLIDYSKNFREDIEDSLLLKYDKIRNKVKNKLAIVPIERNTAKGVYFIIPPQIQMEVANRTKIIYDEYTGRILVDSLLSEEVFSEIENLLA